VTVHALVRFGRSRLLEVVAVRGDELDDSFGSPRNRQKEELARRVGLLLDAWEFEKKSPLTYAEAKEYMAERGFGLARPRWSYLISGNGYLVSDPDFLTALAELFEVEPTYLLDLDSEPSEALKARLDFIQDLRELRVQRFAARNLAGVSPDTLRLITDAIRNSRQKRRQLNDDQEAK
jgi:hypothetical protein